jgi:hypothetical protein
MLPARTAPESGLWQSKNHTAIDTRRVAPDNLLLKPLGDIPMIHWRPVFRAFLADSDNLSRERRFAPRTTTQSPKADQHDHSKGSSSKSSSPSSAYLKPEAFAFTPQPRRISNGPTTSHSTVRARPIRREKAPFPRLLGGRSDETACAERGDVDAGGLSQDHLP